jgi:hypothetical protein
MRILLSITKQSPFFLALEVPKSKDLTLLSQDYPSVSELFRQLDTHRKIERLKIVAETEAYFSHNSSLGRRKSAKSVALRMDNGFTTGGGTSVTGFTIGGVKCSARLAEGGVEITSYLGLEEKSFLVCSQTYDVDNGNLEIEWQKGSLLYGFMSALHASLSKLNHKFVWVFLES